MSINPQENFSPVTDKSPVYITISEFREKVVAGEITDNQGVGYYANADKISSVKVVLSEAFEPEEPPKDPITGQYLPPTKVRNRMANGTHVAWFPNEE